MAKNPEGPSRRRTARIWAWGLVGFAAAVFAVLAWWVPSLEPKIPTGSPEQIQLGEALFRGNCAICHGEAGMGETPGKPNGGRKPDGGYFAPAMNGQGHAWHHPPQALFEIVKNGSPASDSPMKGWKGRLKDEEIRAILAYLLSLWPSDLRQRYRQAHGTR